MELQSTDVTYYLAYDKDIGIKVTSRRRQTIVEWLPGVAEFWEYYMNNKDALTEDWRGSHYAQFDAFESFAGALPQRQ